MRTAGRVRTRSRLYALPGYVSLLLVLVNALPAIAQPITVTGQAYGLAASSSILPTVLAPTPANVAGTAAAPAPGFHASGGAGPIGVPGVAQLGLIAALTEGTIGATTAARSVTSTVTIVGISLINGLVSGGGVTSTCTSGARGSSGSVTLAKLSLAGTPVLDDPAPNTVVGVPGVFNAVLNEQTPRATTDGTSIRVRALDLRVLPTSPGGAILTVVLGEVDCSASGLPPAPSKVRPALTVIAPSVPSLSPSPAASPSPSPSASPSPGASPSPSPAAVPPATPPASITLSPAKGPPGAELSVTASRYSGCPKVQVLLGDTQIGSAVPSASGTLRLADISIPGGVAPGRYEVAARCSSSRVAERLASFTVIRAAVHRSSFVTSVPTPSQLNPRAVGAAAAAGGGVLIIAFPGELFNSTLDENYDEIRGWFGLGPPREREHNRLRELLTFIGFVLASGVLYSALGTGFGLNETTAALAAGMTIALVILVLAYSAPLLLHVRARHGEWGVLKVLPGTLVFAVVCVLLSRAVHFQPGYIFGAIAGLDVAQELATDTTGRLALLASALLLTLGVVAWVAAIPVSHAAGTHPTLWNVTAEACLTTLFVAALESCVICLLPLRFLDGKKLTAWRWAAWGAIFAVAVFAYAEILLAPNSGYAGKDHGAAIWTAIALFVSFGVFSLAFWGYFRFRRPRTTPTPAPTHG